jgi:hypothetical protein
MPSLAPPRPRFDALVAVALLAAGSLAFLLAGSLHPRVGAALGPVGSDEFFRAFAAEIVRVPHWEAIHAGILAGPVLWALGAAAIPRLLPTPAAILGEIGRNALLLAAAAWTVAFVLDGFMAPGLAYAVVNATDIATEHDALRAFHANQRIMARLGMVSIVLIGAAESAFGLALLASARAVARATRQGASWRLVVGASGVLVGLWPILAAARGEFVPGPFTSPYWTITALATGAWFGALASALPLRGMQPDAETDPAAARERGSGDWTAPRAAAASR